MVDIRASLPHRKLDDTHCANVPVSSGSLRASQSSQPESHDRGNERPPLRHSGDRGSYNDRNYIRESSGVISLRESSSTHLGSSQGTPTSNISSLSSSTGGPPNAPTSPAAKTSQHNLTLHLLGVRGATRKTEEIVSSLNKYWTILDINRNKLTKIRRDRLQIDKQENVIEFDIIKAEYKLEQANRRLGVVVADLEETENQIRSLSEDGVFPESIWHMEIKPRNYPVHVFQTQEPAEPIQEQFQGQSQIQAQTQ